MKKRILSMLLCFCMMLNLLTVTSKAASNHTLTVTGGTEGVDYKWGGDIYTTYGELYKANNVLVILTSKALTITGDTTSASEYKDVISINSGVTANLTLNGVKIVSSVSSAGITIAPGGALNLTLQGKNIFQQMQSGSGGTAYNCPAIRVPEGASLTVTAENTGSLISSTFGGSAVIGGHNKENCGTVTINGGTFDLSATGASNVDFVGGPAIGPGAYASKGTITINGGYIKAYSQWGAAIGSGYNAAMGAVGQENETIAINGGTVVATTDHKMADGIGGFAKAISGGVTITGGSVSTVVRNTRPKFSVQNLYKATLKLDDAGAGVSVSKVSVFLNSGLSETYKTTDIKTDTDGKIYVWLPENAIVTAVTAGGETYTGTVQVTTDDSAAGTLTKDTLGYTLTTGVAEHAMLTFSKTTGLKAGDTVLLYIAPDSGYELAGLSLYEGDTPEVPSDTSGFTKIGSNLWSFTMPAGNRKLYVNMKGITNTGDFAVSHATGCSYAYDSTANTLTFSRTGSATVSMKSGVNSTKERIVFESDAAVKLTISSLNIASAKGIDVSDTAGNCELILEGSNQISAIDSNDAGVHKRNGAGTLTFSGSGSLNVKMDRSKISPAGSAIGGNGGETVQGLVFNGGTITANGMTDGAGIGSNLNGGTTSLTIAGGIIKGIGGNYANGIGTGFGKADQITITGGTVYGSGGTMSVDNGGICSEKSTVKITGGSVNMVNLYSSNNSKAYFAQPINASSKSLYLTTITVESGDSLSKNTLVTNLTFSTPYTYGIHDMYTDDSGKLYLWLPVNTVVTGVTTANGTYTGSCTTNDTEQSNHYLKGTAQATFELKGTYFNPVTDITLSSNPGIGETDLSSLAMVNPTNATNKSITWTVTEAGSTGASISGSNLTLSNGGTYKLQATIKNGATASTDFIKTFTLSLKQPSYMTAAAPASVTYGDALSIPVSFTLSDASGAAVDTGASGTVKLSKNSDGSSPIATATVLNGKETLVYQTSGKDLAIGNNTLYVVYDESGTHTATSRMITVPVAKRSLTVDVTFAEKTYDGTKGVTISSAGLLGELSSDRVTLGDYSSITATSVAAGVGKQDVTLNGNFTVSDTDANWYEITQPTGLTVEITKAVGTASVAMESWIYGSSANDPVPTSVTNGTTGVTYQYKVKDAADSTYTAAKPTMVGNYTVQATFPQTDTYKEVKAIADFTITQSGTTFDGGIKTYKDNTETNTFNYGDTITVKVTPKATGKLLGTEGATGIFSAPTDNKMVLYVGSTKIAETNADGNGVYTMTYDTKAKNIVIGDNTIIAKYVGNNNAADHSENVTVKLNKKTITSAVVNTLDASASKKYDGTNSFTNVALTTFTGVESGDIVKATADGTVTDVNVGTSKALTATSVTLSGDHKDYYSLDKAAVSGNVSIIQAATTGVNQELQVVKGLEKEYTFDLTKLLPALSEGKSFGDITYTLGDVADTDNVLKPAPKNSDIKDGKITLKVANVTDKDKQSTVQIKVASKNYKEFTADLTLKTIDKTSLNVEAMFTGGTYNGKPYAYTGTPTFKNGVETLLGITYIAKYAGRDDTTYEECETAPTNVGKYNLILSVSGKSADIYAGTTIIGFEITKKQITAKPNDTSIESNASFPAYTWSIDTGVTGETITATNAQSVVMEAQENGTKLAAVKEGTFDIVFTIAPTFNQKGDIEKNYDIQMGKGKLTVTKYTSGGGSSGGGIIATSTPEPPAEKGTGTVVYNNTGQTVKGVETKVTTESNGTKTVEVKSSEAIIIKQPDGTEVPLKDTSKLGFSGTGSSNVTISSDGNIDFKNLSKGTETKLQITYDAGNGQKLCMGTVDIKVSATGEVSVVISLIDPYGTITDSATGKVIDGANVTLYYADTERNKANGKTPNTVVQLPIIDEFEPNNNKNPQFSDATGAYGFMVFPTTDYYIVATKDGYRDYKSPTISVEQEIVKWDFKMDKKDASKPVIVLTGEPEVTVKLQDSYKELGATAKDSKGGDLSSSIVIAGSVDTDKLGDYTITYTVKDVDGNTANVTRTVHVTGVDRIAGNNRVDTAIEIAKASYKTQVSNVILATADNYPDALAGSVLAHKINAPILLVGSSDEDQKKVLDYIKANMNATGTVYILGGTGVVSSSFEGSITANGFKNIKRLGGADRYETSVKIAEELNVNTGTPMVLVSGDNYADALSVSSSAAINGTPILLVGKDGISDAVKKKIGEIKPSKVYIIGLEGAVSTSVENQVSQVTALDKANIVRLGGQDRFGTSLEVAKYFNLSGQSVCLATGKDFPDALAGSAYAAKQNAPVVLVGDELTDDVKTYLKEKNINSFTIFGGEGAVGDDVQGKLVKMGEVNGL